MKKERIIPHCVLESTSLVCKVNPSIVKVQISVNKDTMPVKEVVDGGDERSIGEAKVKIKGVAEEHGVDGGSIVIIYITERGGVRWGGKSSNGTDGKSGGSKKV